MRHLYCVLCFIFGMVACRTVVHAETIRWGPLGISLGMQAGIEYNDNVNTSSSNPKTDIGFTFGPIANGILQLPITPDADLTVNTSLGFTYKRYIKHGQESTFSSPISVALTLPWHVEEWLVTVSDNFNFSNDPLESAVSVGRKRVTQYNNLGSLSAFRRFGRFALNLETQRMDRWAPQDPTTEETVYSFSITPSVYLQETFSVFWANSVGFVYPEMTVSRSKGFNMTSMIGVSGLITPVLSGSVGVGYVHSEFDPVNSPFGNKPGASMDNASANISLNYSHPLRPNTTHSLSVFYSPGVTATMDNSNYQTTYGLSYKITHRLNRQLTLSPTIAWAHQQDESGLSGQENDTIRLDLGLTRSFGRHLTGTLNYLYQTRSSNKADQSYDVNRVTLSFTYMF